MVDVVVDPHISLKLRPHQRDGVIFLYECMMNMRDYNGSGAILALVITCTCAVLFLCGKKLSRRKSKEIRWNEYDNQ